MTREFTYIEPSASKTTGTPPSQIPIGEITQEANKLAIQNYDKYSEGIVGQGEGEARAQHLNKEVMRKAVKEAIRKSGASGTYVAVGSVDASGRPLADAAGLPLETYISKGPPGGDGNGIPAFKDAVNGLDAAIEEKDKSDKSDQTTETNAAGEETTKYIKDSEQARLEQRFQEQCFLIDNYEKIVPTNMYTPYGKYFTCISADPSRVVTRISTTEEIQPFVDLQPFEVAGSHPQLRFFKVDYVKSRYGRTKEILFSDHTKKKSIDEYFSNAKGRHDGVGIKSFVWSFIGRSDVEVDRNIEAKLVLSFRNLEDLQPSDLDRKKYATVMDMLLYQPGGRVRKVKTPYGMALDEWDPSAFEIKVLVGWSVPTQDDDMASAALKSFLRSQSTTMQLILRKHAFNFKEDGSGTVEIEFQGIIEAYTSHVNSDIFNLGKSFKKAVEKKRAVLKKARTKAEKSTTRAEQTEGFLNKIGQGLERAQDYALDALGSESVQGKDNVSLSTKAARDMEEVERLEEDMDKFVSDQKSSRYQLLLKRLYEKGTMRYIDVTAEDIGLMVKGQNSRKQSAMLRKYGLAKTKGKEKSPPRTRPQNIIIQKANPGGGNLQATAGQAGTAAGNVAKAMQNASGGIPEKEAETDKGREDALNANVDSAQTILQAGKPAGQYRINFFFLGDLLEVAFSLLGNTLGQEKPASATLRYLLGEVSFIDPLTGAVRAFNLADVPVSLILFLQWYNNKAIKPQRETWPIDLFIKDVINDLVLSALSPSCFMGYPTKPKLHVSYLEGPGEGKKLNRDRVPRNRRINSISKIGKHPNIHVATTTGAGRLFSYNFIYAHNAPSPGLTGNVKRDSVSGIYHFFIGADRGLLKSISYEKTDQPYVKEARSEMEGIDPISAQLREQYKVSIKSIGSTMFRPGQYAYIHPRVAGGGPARRNSLTMKLGMAGYVFITKVENIIEPGRFETRLEGINDGIIGGRGGSKIKRPKRLTASRGSVVEQGVEANVDPRTAEGRQAAKAMALARGDKSSIPEAHKQKLADEAAVAKTTAEFNASAKDLGLAFATAGNAQPASTPPPSIAQQLPPSQDPNSPHYMGPK